MIKHQLSQLEDRGFEADRRREDRLRREKDHGQAHTTHDASIANWQNSYTSPTTKSYRQLKDDWQTRIPKPSLHDDLQNPEARVRAAVVGGEKPIVNEKFLFANINTPVGSKIPLCDPHAISVSLPTWDSHLGWANREDWVVSKMNSGYPRFFVNKPVTLLGEKIVERYRKNPKDEAALIFLNKEAAEECRKYILIQQPSEEKQLDIYIVELVPKLDPPEDQAAETVADCMTLASRLHCAATIFPTKVAQLAKQFWQHAGMGISTRQATLLTLLFVRDLLEGLGPTIDSAHGRKGTHGELTRDLYAHLMSEVPINRCAKTREALCANLASLYVNPVSTEDIFLFPSGMAALYHSFRAISHLQPHTKTVCYGFLYVDTYKILSNFGYNCHFIGHITEASLEELSALLDSQPKDQQYTALYAEVLTNPLLATPNLPRLREITNKHNILLILDDTLAPPTNVSIVPYADIIATSLTKSYSGKCNVMGGSLLISPYSRRHDEIRAYFAAQVEVPFFPADLDKLFRNSLDFPSRMSAMSRNALLIAETMHTSSLVKKVYYPPFVPTHEMYLSLAYGRGGGATASTGFENIASWSKQVKPQYGPLLSIHFKSSKVAHRFFDVLEIAKGPSLGTDFTLGCAYTLLAHAKELEWAAGYGVVEGLVRISAGVETAEWIDNMIRKALSKVQEELDNGLLGGYDDDSGVEVSEGTGSEKDAESDKEVEVVREVPVENETKLEG
ncbi:PLP-dependent transferase [Ascobolus immersus RN42]|uniref:PLP-dependent transferase n=1 Tax=Ascobolus immersus RN42 TaxID=1160509 RepID=A0A3N4HQW6_ASCIM|nr:PLP-dependent transferase [Ascobolus immersus RN42]